MCHKRVGLNNNYSNQLAYDNYIIIIIAVLTIIAYWLLPIADRER